MSICSIQCMLLLKYYEIISVMLYAEKNKKLNPSISHIVQKSHFD